MGDFFLFKQKTAYEMRISDWSADVCSSDRHLGRGPAVERRRLHRDQHKVGGEQRRAHQAGDTRRPVDDDVIDVARQLRRFTVERVARQADNAEQPLQSLPAALLRPVQRGTLRVGVDQRDALSTASPFTSEMQGRSEEHTSELQSLMRISYAVFCLKKKKTI